MIPDYVSEHRPAACQRGGFFHGRLLYPYVREAAIQHLPRVLRALYHRLVETVEGSIDSGGRGMDFFIASKALTKFKLNRANAFSTVDRNHFKLSKKPCHHVQT